KTCWFLGDGGDIRGPAAEYRVQHSHNNSQVCARTEGEVQAPIPRNWSHARMGDYHFPAVVSATPDVVGCNGSTLADIGTDDKQNFGFRNLAPWDRAAVDTECQFVCGASRHHAEPSVVVDVPSPKRDACKLA